jgi:tellurite resistance protein TehA-like permease
MRWIGEPMKRAFMAASANLFPAYFALVMATGIVSIAAYRLELWPVAWALLGLNIAFYTILWLLLLVRLVWFLPHVLADFTNHARGAGFFTLVAGTCVLGVDLLVVTDAGAIAQVLWVLGLLLWLLVMFSFFTVVTVREEKPALDTGINGAWLLAAVATQSVAVLGTLLAPRFAAGRTELLFFTLCMYLLGCMLYLSIITLIFYRLTFITLTSAELTPPYWINMGAVAITTLAGATLILNAAQLPLLGEILPFLKGFTLFFWAAGTWWIPLLFILGVWRHVYKRYPLTYDPQYWGMVFPLGMYTASTFQLSKALGLDFLLAIPRVFIGIALVAWLATFVGLIRHVVASVAHPSHAQESPRGPA